MDRQPKYAIQNETKEMACVKDTRKEIERQHLHSFRYLCPDFPAGELIESETPDFLLVTDAGRNIGIEHTQVFKQDGADETAEQADEATKEFIKTAAKQRAEALDLPPAHVTLFFNPQYLRRTVGSKRRSFTKAERQTIAENIATFVSDHMPVQGHSVELDWRPGQPRQVDLIHINRVHPVDRHDWHWLEMNAIQYDAIERLQAAITRKSKMYDACRRVCDECWLLVVAHSFLSSGTIHPGEASLAHVYNSPFNRSYFLDFGLGRIALLNIKQDSVI
jgi:hypothetical protein